MSDKTEYYLTRLRNILIFMDKHDSMDNEYYNNVIDAYNSLIGNDLNEDRLRDIKKLLDYFKEEIYPNIDSPEKQINRKNQ